MICTACGKHNRGGARVCRHCGRHLVVTCPRCRHENRGVARFCRHCGAALDPAVPRQVLPDAKLAQQSALSSHSPARHAPLLNGRYAVRRLLAKGGMGSVYEVGDTTAPGTIRAVKEMDLATVEQTERQGAVADFRREASLLRTLSHPNLVKVLDHFAVGDKEYLVMEYVQGETLESFMRNRPRTEAQVLPIALQLCDVLDYLHSRTPPIIYRDLKPSNALVETATGLVKLIDFGIARFYKPGKKKDTKMMGTPGFAPPEQYGDGQTDARSDVFALGVTLHVLLTDYDVEQSLWSYPPVTTLNPQISATLERIILRATEMRVSDRYQRVAELRDALMACSRPHATDLSTVRGDAW
ncbi:MAG: protein kinase [Anaerolineales bacterium]|nr:protein kinase [Anaerolineales bacterium]